MNTPRIEVDLSKIRHNTQTLARQLTARGIAVTGVTKAVCGHPAIALAMLDGGALGLAEARLSNVRRLREAGITGPITLIRTPMLSQVDQVVQFCQASYNTQLVVIAALAAAAIRKNTVHGIILMVEMGDLREGIMPDDLGAIARQVVEMPGVVLKGIGANFACLSGNAPGADKMKALSALTTHTERSSGSFLQTISGGNSATLPWALGAHAPGRVNDLRLGEAILLGVDPVSGDQINGLHTDAFALVAEVIETDAKHCPAAVSRTDSTSEIRRHLPNSEGKMRSILGIGHQDIDVSGLRMPLGKALIGATSDHLIIATNHATLRVGSEIRFQLNYSALMRAMAAPDIQTTLLRDRPAPQQRDPQKVRKHLALV